jgi:hypothetical protein
MALSTDVPEAPEPPPDWNNAASTDAALSDAALSVGDANDVDKPHPLWRQLLFHAAGIGTFAVATAVVAVIWPFLLFIGSYCASTPDTGNWLIVKFGTLAVAVSWSAVAGVWWLWARSSRYALWPPAIVTVLSVTWGIVTVVMAEPSRWCFG